MVPTVSSGPGPTHYRGFMITLRHNTPLSDITQHSQQTDTHAKGGILTHNPSMRAVAHPRLRPSGHRDQPTILLGRI